MDFGVIDGTQQLDVGLSYSKRLYLYQKLRTHRNSTILLDKPSCLQNRIYLQL